MSATVSHSARELWVKDIGQVIIIHISSAGTLFWSRSRRQWELCPLSHTATNWTYSGGTETQLRSLCQSTAECKYTGSGSCLEIASLPTEVTVPFKAKSSHFAFRVIIGLAKDLLSHLYDGCSFPWTLHSRQFTVVLQSVTALYVHCDQIFHKLPF